MDSLKGKGGKKKKERGEKREREREREREKKRDLGIYKLDIKARDKSEIGLFPSKRLEPTL